MKIQHITELFSLDDREFITEAYRTLLNREPDENGLSYYIGRLNQGHSKSSVIAQLARSPECSKSNKILGLKELLSSDNRSRNWFFRLFTKRQKIETILESIIVKLGHLARILQENQSEQPILLIEKLTSLAENITRQKSEKHGSRENERNRDSKDLSPNTSVLAVLEKRFFHSSKNGGQSNICFIDVTTILKWDRPPVGIIRTLFEIIRYSINQTAIKVEYYAFNNAKDRIRVVDAEIIANLLFALEDSSIECDYRSKILAEAKNQLEFSDNTAINPLHLAPYGYEGISPLFDAPRLLAKNIFCPFRENDIVISIGLDWDNSNYSLIHSLKNLYRFKFIGAFYDGIPITQPEFLPNLDFCGMFFDYFCLLSNMSDKIFTISKKSEYEYSRINNYYKIPGTKNIRVIRLGDPKPQAIPTSAENFRNINLPFVIYVSTIEKRKNHILLLRVWHNLFEKLGNRTPTLVCIGMWGWGVDDVKEFFLLYPHMQQNVKFLHDVNDDDLIWFYNNARFAVFPSHDEGWGLGASESLTYSLPCVTSSTPALLEATQNLMPHCNSNDQVGWLNIIEKMSVDDKYIESLRLIAKEQYVHRSWQDFSEDFFKFAIAEGNK